MAYDLVARLIWILERLEVISKLLGHSSTTITERSYAALFDETIAREAMAV